MSLTWSMTGVKDIKDLHVPNPDRPGELMLDGISKSLVFMTMFIGMDEITKDNMDEFYTRAHIWEKCFGALTCGMVDDKPVDRPIEYADVVRRIGLKTNGGSMTKAAWSKHVMTRLYADAYNKLRSAKETENADPGTGRSIPDLQRGGDAHSPDSLLRGSGGEVSAQGSGSGEGHGKVRRRKIHG
jgi:hypothetical protein